MSDLRRTLLPGPPRTLGTGRAPDALPPPVGAHPDLWLVRERPVTGADLDLLDAGERATAAEYRTPRDRVSYVVAHAALRRLLGAYTGTPPERVRLTRAPCPLCGGPHGRPRLAGPGPHFSLSHTRDLSVLAFAGTPVGADVEILREPGVAAAVARILHPRETAELGALAPGARPAALARAWVRKEAYLKGLGTGLGRAPDRDYVGTGPRPAALAGWTLADVPLDSPLHTAAVAVRH